jgi:hypothetical protein
MWSHDVVATLVGFSNDLKMGQYLKVRLGLYEIVVWVTNKGVVKDTSSFHVHSSTLGNGYR